MYMTDKTRLIGGLAMILMAIATVVLVALNAMSGVEGDPGDRADVAAFLTDTAKHQELLVAANSLGLFSDAVLALIVGASLFTLFRDRSAILSAILLVGIVSAATMSATNDVATIIGTFVAEDFVRGGVTGATGGEAAALQVGRVLGMFSFTMFLAINIAFGVAAVSLGAIVARAPQGAVNPPRWLGWVAIISGVFCWATPLVFVHDALFIFFPLQLVTMLIVFIGLGGWLVTHSDEESATQAQTFAEPRLSASH